MSKTLDEQIMEKIRPIVAKQFGIEMYEVQASANLSHDLGADSLDALDLRMAVEKEFNIKIPDEDTMNIVTISDAIDYIHQRISPNDFPKKKKVDTKTHIGVSFGVTGYDRLSCGYLPNDEIYDYLKKLAKQDLGKPHCARYGFSFMGYPYGKNYMQSLMIDAIAERGNGNVYGLNPLCGAHGVGGCFRRLKKGECRDQFIIENIGKVFWPDKYGKQR